MAQIHRMPGILPCLSDHHNNSLAQPEPLSHKTFASHQCIQLFYTFIFFAFPAFVTSVFLLQKTGIEGLIANLIAAIAAFLSWKPPFLMLILFSPDKQNELELPCPVPKPRERKRRQGQQQQQQQQQHGGMMTQISGVRKVSHTSSISGGTGNRFGVKTDQEELLSKVSDRQTGET